MKKILNASLAYCIIVLTNFHSMAQEKPLSTARQLRSSAVAVIVYDKSDKIISRSGGFIISETGDVLTYLQIPNDARRIEVKTSDEQSHKITRITVAESEIGLWRVSTNIPAPIQPPGISSITPAIGERILVISSTGKDQAPWESTVAAINNSSGYDRVIQISGSIPSGFLGGPVVNMRGEVIGLAVSRTEDGKEISMAILKDRLVNIKPDSALIVGGASLDSTGIFTLGEVVKRVEPTTPPLAAAAHLTGVVEVEIIIDEEGNVTAARPISGHPLLRDVAMSAAKQWKFAASRYAGIPVRFIGIITFNFVK